MYRALLHYMLRWVIMIYEIVCSYSCVAKPNNISLSVPRPSFGVPPGGGC